MGFVFIVEFPLSSSGSTECHWIDPVFIVCDCPLGWSSVLPCASSLQVLFCESASDCIIGPRMFLFPCFLPALFLQLLHLLLHPLPLWTMIRFTHLPRAKRVRHLRGQKISTLSTHVAIEVSSRAQLKTQSDAPTLNVASLDMITWICPALQSWKPEEDATGLPTQKRTDQARLTSHRFMRTPWFPQGSLYIESNPLAQLCPEGLPRRSFGSTASIWRSSHKQPGRMYKKLRLFCTFPLHIQQAHRLRLQRFQHVITSNRALATSLKSSSSHPSTILLPVGFYKAMEGLILNGRSTFRKEPHSTSGKLHWWR